MGSWRIFYEYDIHAELHNFDRQLDITLFSKSIDPEIGMLTIVPKELETVPVPGDHMQQMAIEPTFTLTHAQAQQLFDQLHRKGFRPREKVFGEVTKTDDQIMRMERHISDIKDMHKDHVEDLRLAIREHVNDLRKTIDETVD